MKTGPYKPAPHEYTGYFLDLKDATQLGKLLCQAAHLAYDTENTAMGDDLLNAAYDLLLIRELPSVEEETIKARMNTKAKLVAYPDGEELEKQIDAQQNEWLTAVTR